VGHLKMVSFFQLISHGVQHMDSLVISSIQQLRRRNMPHYRMWKRERGVTEDWKSNGAYCPKGRVVMGDLIDIGELASR